MSHSALQATAHHKNKYHDDSERGAYVKSKGTRQANYQRALKKYAAKAREWQAELVAMTGSLGRGRRDFSG